MEELTADEVPGRVLSSLKTSIGQMVSSVQCGLCFNTIMSTDGYPGVEVRHLQALRAVSETSSFSRAAEKLGYAQSAVSQQISALERAVGVQLVERPGGPRPVSLTEAGAVLDRHAISVLARLAEARADLDSLVSGSSGTVRVGTFQSTGARILPAVLRQFRERLPGIRVELIERQDEDELLALAKTGELDLTFAIVADDRDRAGFYHSELMSDRYVVLAPPGSRFDGRDNVRVIELEGEELIVNGDRTSCMRNVSEAWRDAGYEPSIVFTTDDNLTLQRLVGTGLGHAIVPELAIEREVDAGSAVICELAKGEIAPRRIGLFWPAGRSRSTAACAFVDIAAEVCAGDLAFTT
jgi:DNA-binding transcriptional LysR family regulator